MAEKFTNVEDYLESLDPEVRSVLKDVRVTIHAAVPDGEDAISYNLPTLRIGERRIVHYAGWKKHISLYPAPDDEDLQPELAPYSTGKGTLKFPLDQPLPHDLIARVARRLSGQRPGS